MEQSPPFRHLKALALGTGAVFALFLIIALVFAHLLAHPAQFACESPKEKALYHYCKDPAALGLTFEEVAFDSADGTALKGWWIPGQGSRAVIFVHGRHAGRWAVLRYARAYQAAGLHVLAFDLRRHGQSQMTLSSMGYHESFDVEAAYRFARDVKAMKSVGLYGFSMGAVASVLAFERQREIGALVAEAPYARLDDLLAEVAWRDFFLPRYPLVPLTAAIFAVGSGIPRDGLDIVTAFAHLDRPVFLIHGMADAVIGVDHARRLLDARKVEKVWIVPGGGHVDSWNRDSEAAEKETITFFKQFL